MHRVVAWQTGYQDIALALSADALLLGGLGVSHFQLGWPSVLGGVYSVAAGLAILAWPAHALGIFVSATVVWPSLFVARGLPGWWRGR